MISQQSSKRKSSFIFSSAKKRNKHSVQIQPSSFSMSILGPTSKILRLDHLSYGYDPSDLSPQDIYNPIVPFFLRKTLPCKCISSLTACGLFSSVINPRKLSEMDIQYSKLLEEAETQVNRTSMISTHNSRYSEGQSPILPRILIPHMINLKKLLQLDSQSQLAVSGILNHAKSSELTFWLYCELVAHMPLKNKLFLDFKDLLKKKSRTLNQSLKDEFGLESFINDIHKSKGARLISVQHFARFVVVMITSIKKNILARIVFCYLIYIKHSILNDSNQEIKVVTSFMRSTEMDWQTILNAAQVLQE